MIRGPIIGFAPTRRPGTNPAAGETTEPMENNERYLYFQNMLTEVEIPKGGIISRTLNSDDNTRVVVFGFDTGQELTEHTSTMPAVIQILQGEGTLTLGPDTKEAQAGTFALMEPNLPHSIVAKTPLIMLLVMMPAGRKAA